jgi:hypothetical protein
MNNFVKTIMYKKGELGEKIVDEMLVNGGEWIPYKSLVDGAHPFDRLVARKNKKELMILETADPTFDQADLLGLTCDITISPIHSSACFWLIFSALASSLTSSINSSAEPLPSITSACFFV